MPPCSEWTLWTSRRSLCRGGWCGDCCCSLGVDVSPFLDARAGGGEGADETRAPTNRAVLFELLQLVFNAFYPPVIANTRGGRRS